MAPFTPFMQSTQAQGIIDSYLNGDYKAQPNVNSAGNFRNPFFDLRTEQENAGTLDPSALYPNSQIDYSAETPPPDPCQEGFMLVDGVCQPIETFGQSMYDENKDDNNEGVEGRKPLINMTPDELFEFGKSKGYLNEDGFVLSPQKVNSNFMGFIPEILKSFAPSLNQHQFNSFLNSAGRLGLLNRMSGTGAPSSMDTQMVNSNPMLDAYDKVGIKNLPTIVYGQDELNQTDQERFYQNQAFQSNNQGNYQAPQMTRQQIKDDADKSGGTRNPFEMNQVNNYSPNNVGYKPAQRRNPNMNDR
jgi:hypothetical protein